MHTDADGDATSDQQPVVRAATPPAADQITIVASSSTIGQQQGQVYITTPATIRTQVPNRQLATAIQPAPEGRLDAATAQWQQQLPRDPPVVPYEQWMEERDRWSHTGNKRERLPLRSWSRSRPLVRHGRNSTGNVTN